MIATTITFLFFSEKSKKMPKCRIRLAGVALAACNATFFPFLTDLQIFAFRDKKQKYLIFFPKLRTGKLHKMITVSLCNLSIVVLCECVIIITELRKSNNQKRGKNYDNNDRRNVRRNAFNT